MTSRSETVGRGRFERIKSKELGASHKLPQEIEKSGFCINLVEGKLKESESRMESDGGGRNERLLPNL